MKIAIKALMGVALGMLASGTAHGGLIVGDIVNIDFNSSTSTTFGSAGVGPTATGSAAIGATGDFWNGETSPFTQTAPPSTATDPALKTAANVASGLTLTFATDTDGGILAGFNQGSTANTANPQLMQDYLFSLQTTSPGDTFANFSGVPNGTYNLFLYSQPPSGDNRIAGFIFGGVTKTAGGTAASNDTGFVAGQNYVEFTGISPTSGALNTQFYAAGGGEGDFNGMQLQVVSLAPEPGSLGLLGLCGALLLHRRRRITQSADR